ncbi:unnamed protein product [Oppiella nova]|uniref:Peptidase S1 domain-containing protein n=1 Tax=Oppiella nova TaxID=334625 RepID=A0A7R9QU73_9ACAR|nr:unnamed protein product [Oppiella nova]CAG2175685.1 unnamed protein product [Oppiella nova]
MKYLALILVLTLWLAATNGRKLEVSVQANSGDRIVGGVDATADQAPFQVSLQYQGWFGWSHICGGSLVGTQSVVTAAHCTDGATASQLRVAYGGLDRTNLAYINPVVTIYQHSQYNTPTELNYDYTVLRLQDKIQTSATIKTIELIDASPAVGSKAQLTGWGQTIGTDSNSSPTKLQYAEFTTITREECQRRADNTIKNAPTVTTQMICGENKSASGCYGDSGGPFVIGGKLAGIVSWGTPNCPADTTVGPTVYSDVGNLRTWLLATASQLRVAYGGLDRTNLAYINPVVTIYQHSQYNTPTELNYDYTVLRLQDKIQTSATIKTIELIDASPAVGSKAQLTGWGQTIGTDSNSSPTKLQYAEFTTITREECQRRADNTIKNAPTVTTQMICGENKSASGCYGDSGGPFVIGGKLAGIVSWGTPNCPADTTVGPTVYSDVGNLRTWLLSNIV